MAVDFPGDLIADVARAADRQSVEQARARLAGIAEMSGTAASAFTEALRADVEAPLPTAGAGPKDVATMAPKNDAAALQRFEAMMLQQMIEQMMPKEAGAVYGNGFAGDMWRSLQAEKIGESFAERGGIGIAETITGRLAMAGGDVRSSTADGASIVDKITFRMLRDQQGG
ncbi:rod-binding protein [Notoacmeibacter ruber]|uniref:Flagellar biosynthesis protein FlgJ n=1 Tax=Notoacmeibacter ruber TaxID=2670375 RepID=A0A3L7JDP4_9HYPH|nr:rod-binding protein [Notoacmeibacter ruber]RLQ88796.1 flagellar biosynthesis protein FlgJ [Notoacmeibacter ruber]